MSWERGLALLQPADIVAVHGSGFFSRGILRATGNTVSHVGLVIGARPALVIEALLRVKTNPLVVTIENAERAYLLHARNLTETQRAAIVAAGAKFSADGYNWGDILLQGLDSLAHTTWFTDHLSLGLAGDPICSYLVAAAYRTVGLNFGAIKTETVRPSDIYLFARAHGGLYEVEQIK